jgi:pimeloyl-ACP methyl ester carboxylesterase
VEKNTIIQRVALMLCVFGLAISFLPVSAQGGPGTKDFAIRDFGACINLPDFTEVTEPDEFNTLYTVPGLFSINFAEYLMPLTSLPADSNEIYNAMISLLNTVDASGYAQIDFDHPEYISAAVEFTLDDQRMFGMIYRNQSDKLFFLFADKVEGFDMLAIGRAIFAADDDCTALNPEQLAALASGTNIPLRFGEVVEHPRSADSPYTFYTYFPNSARSQNQVTIAVWPHGGGAANDDYGYHEQMARDKISWLSRYAERYRMPVVVVAMPRVNHLYVHALHSGTFTTGEEFLRRPDLKLIDAVWDHYMPMLRGNDVAVDEQVYMMGFSSPGMFAHRFAMLHPTRVKALWLGGHGPAPLPIWELNGYPLNYPLGPGNLQALSGAPFDFEAYRTIPHFVCVGENDTNPNNDTTTYTDIFTEEERLFIRANFGSTNPERLRFFYETLVSQGIPAEFRLYPNTAHQNTNEMLNDAFAFLTRH